MASAPPYTAMDGKEVESMQQSATAPPIGPPPTYSEAMNSSPYPAMPVPTTTSAAHPSGEPAMPLPTQAAAATPPYPIDDNVTAELAKRVAGSSTAPYPIDDSAIPQPMTMHVHPASTMPQPAHLYPSQPMGFTDSPHINHHPRDYQQQPIVNQPAAYHDEYVHPKTTYVVLQDQRNRRRRNHDDECGCTDWLMCCWCFVEACRCLVLCAECAAACK